MHDEILENLYLQSWTQNGSRQYWNVHSGASPTLLGSADSSRRRRRRVNALYEQEEKRLAARRVKMACNDTGIDDLVSLVIDAPNQLGEEVQRRGS